MPDRKASSSKMPDRKASSSCKDLAIRQVGGGVALAALQRKHARLAVGETVILLTSSLHPY